MSREILHKPSKPLLNHSSPPLSNEKGRWDLDRREKKREVGGYTSSCTGSHLGERRPDEEDKM